MLSLMKSKKSVGKKENQVQGLSVQDLIPLKDIQDGILITPDNKMVQCIKVSAINLELTSNAECNEIFETFEGFLKTLTYHVVFTNVSMPVDLTTYINDEKQILNETKNPFKQMLLESYIDYSEEIEINQDIMQRQRYVIFAEKMKEDTPEERYETTLEIEEKKQEIVDSLSELELTAEGVTDIELIRYLHTMFDYSTAQNRPIESSFVPQIIQGGRS